MALLKKPILNLFKGNRASNAPTRQDLWFLPLGGTGEIGMNANLYGHHNQWLLVDCGVGFDNTGTRRYLPDTRFIEENRHKLQAIVITHGHQDHIGALVKLWPLLKAPIYATPFAAAILRQSLTRNDDEIDLPIKEIVFNQDYFFGTFSVRWMPIPHSIPEASALLIETSAGRVLHSGDWRFDTSPVIHSGFNQADFKQLQKLSIDAMVSDSTNATKHTSNASESELFNDLKKVIKKQSGRVVVSCFSTNISRIITIARVAQHLNKKCAVLGRSIENMQSIAKRLGYWPEGLSLVNPHHIGYLPANDIIVIATGSQAEPNATLQKLLMHRHPLFYLEAGDTVIYSAIRIPVNEERIIKQMEAFKNIGINVVHADDERTNGLKLHASGHANAEDIKKLYQLVRPKLLIPTHGETHHMTNNALVAKKCGIENVLMGCDGDLFKLKPFAGKVRGFVKIEPILLN